MRRTMSNLFSPNLTRATRIRLALPTLVDPLNRFINIVGRTLGKLLAPSGPITVYRKPVDFMEG